MHIDPAHQSVKFCQAVSNALIKRRAMIEYHISYKRRRKEMKSNIKRLSLCLSADAADTGKSADCTCSRGRGGCICEFYGTFWSLVPPLVAIALALITKEVYSSLFVGILVGALFYSNFNFEGTILHIFEGGMISVLTDSYNMGILIFLVILGTWYA